MMGIYVDCFFHKRRMSDITIQPLPLASRPSHHAPRRGRHSVAAGGGVQVGVAREPREKGVLAEIRELLSMYMYIYIYIYKSIYNIYNLYKLCVYIYNYIYNYIYIIIYFFFLIIYGYLYYSIYIELDYL